jgi:S-methylmethionine-dependent homocysteine/selenocysteine methylase
MTNGETMDELVRSLDTKDRHVDAILLMCSKPEAISATLPRLRAAYSGPIGAYANIGYYHRPTQPVHYPESQYHALETGEYTPERYAEYGRRWLDMGATIIGGCCGTTPDHISALRPIVAG